MNEMYLSNTCIGFCIGIRIKFTLILFSKEYCEFNLNGYPVEYVNKKYKQKLSTKQ